MSIDIDALIDTYTVMKEYIPSKESMQDAARVLASYTVA